MFYATFTGTAFADCAVCGHRFRVPDNLGRWACIFHRHATVDAETRRYRCCGGREGSPGCVRQDHNEHGPFPFTEADDVPVDALTEPLANARWLHAVRKVEVVHDVAIHKNDDTRVSFTRPGPDETRTRTWADVAAQRKSGGQQTRIVVRRFDDGASGFPPPGQTK